MLMFNDNLELLMSITDLDGQENIFKLLKS